MSNVEVPEGTPGKLPKSEISVFLHERLAFNLNGRRRVVGMLMGWDSSLNIVLDDACELTKEDKFTNIGVCAIKGNSILSITKLPNLD